MCTDSLQCVQEQCVQDSLAEQGKASSAIHRAFTEVFLF
jgi:hypothetical protein